MFLSSKLNRVKYEKIRARFLQKITGFRSRQSVFAVCGIAPHIEKKNALVSVVLGVYQPL